jgi:hypothetical protein
VTAWPEPHRRGLLAAVAARAEAWLLEPAQPHPRAADPEPGARAVVAVVGLGSHCGTTTIARALAIELARRDASGAAIVSAWSRAGAAAIAGGTARRLARALPAGAAAAGRLCLVDADDPALRQLALNRPAPVVLDVGHGTPPEPFVALADEIVLVAAPSVEPALADVVAASLSRGSSMPTVVLNRGGDAGAWASRDVLEIAEVRLGARLALAGRDPTPALARPIAELADLLVGEGEP